MCRSSSITGRGCNECISGYWNISNGCTECNCSVTGSTAKSAGDCHKVIKKWVILAWILIVIVVNDTCIFLSVRLVDNVNAKKVTLVVLVPNVLMATGITMELALV